MRHYEMFTEFEKERLAESGILFDIQDPIMFGIDMGVAENNHKIILDTVTKIAYIIADEEQRTIIEHIKANPRLITRPCDEIMDGGGFTYRTAMRPSCEYQDGEYIAYALPIPQTFNRFDIGTFFIAFPKALPIELKGIAV